MAEEGLKKTRNELIHIGTAVERWLLKDKDHYQVDTLDMQDETWRDTDFSQYDVVYHVAGIAHADVGNVTEEQKQLYYKVNTDLTIEVVERARQAKVKQFIFMSWDAVKMFRKKYTK